MTCGVVCDTINTKKGADKMLNYNKLKDTQYNCFYDAESALRHSKFFEFKASGNRWVLGKEIYTITKTPFKEEFFIRLARVQD